MKTNDSTAQDTSIKTSRQTRLTEAMKITDQGLGLVRTTSGAVTGEDLLEAHTAYLAENEDQFTNCRYWLYDYSKADCNKVQTHDIMRLAALHRSVASKNPALVVASCCPGDLEFGLSRMWEAFVQPSCWNTRTFRTAEEAKEWISAKLGETTLSFD